MLSFKEYITEGNSWEDYDHLSDGHNPENESGKTQVKNTGGTFKKTGVHLRKIFDKEDSNKSKRNILNVGAGLEHTSKSVHEGLGENHGHNIDDQEPNIDKRKEKPKYHSYGQDLPHDHYHAVVSHNVLNVLEPHHREQVLHNVFRTLKEKGHGIIGARKWAGDIDKVSKNKGRQARGDNKALWVNQGKNKKTGKDSWTYQKGFDKSELKDHIQDYADRHGHEVEFHPTSKEKYSGNTVHFNLKHKNHKSIVPVSE